MARMQAARARVEQAKTAEFTAAAATKEAERALRMEEGLCGVKSKSPEEEDEPSYVSWSRSTWLKMESWAERRRAEPLREGGTAAAPRDGADGYLHHRRRGLVGAVQFYARAGVKYVLDVDVDNELRARCE